MSTGAHVTSIDTIREFRASLNTFLFEAREALISHDMEVSRALEYMLQGLPAFWQAEIRKAEQAVNAATVDLHRARSVTLPGGGAPACLEEKKAVQRAKARLDYAMEKLQLVKRVGRVCEREATEYYGRANQLAGLLDNETPKAVILLDRVLNSLDAYTNTQHPGDGLERGDTAAVGAGSMAQPVAEKPAGEKSADNKAAATAGGATQPAAGGEAPAEASAASKDPAASSAAAQP